MANCERCLNNPMGTMCTSMEMQNAGVDGFKCKAYGEDFKTGKINLEKILREQNICFGNPKLSFVGKVRSFFLDYTRGLREIIPHTQTRNQLS